MKIWCINTMKYLAIKNVKFAGKWTDRARKIMLMEVTQASKIQILFGMYVFSYMWLIAFEPSIGTLAYPQRFYRELGGRESFWKDLPRKGK